MNPATPPARTNGLVLYFGTTFVFSWACWAAVIALGGPAFSSPNIVFYLLGAFGPSIGAIVVRVARAVRGAPAPAHAVPLWSGARLVWVPVMLVLASATVMAGVLLTGLPNGSLDLSAPGKAIAATGGLGAFVFNMLAGGPVGEEPGWRGTAYPRLRAHLGRIPAALLLSVVWAVWHLPLFFVTGTVQNSSGLVSANGVMYLFSIVGVGLLTVVAYEKAGVFAAIAVHLAVNTTLSLMIVSSPATTAVILGIQLIVAPALPARGRSGNFRTANLPGSQIRS